MSIDARFKIDKGDFALDVYFKIPAQGVTAFFGPSGCGKTTLLRAIAGLEESPHKDKQSGYLKVGDEIWQDDNIFLPPHQRPIGYVFQEASLFSHMNVQRNLEYGLKRVATQERKVSLEQAIELLDIGSLLKRSIDQLSGGERQRVAIAQALAVSPRILLMDEPLAALDMKRKQEILPYLDSLHNELDIPIIYVSHSTSEVARLADHLVYLQEGRILASGDIHEMLTRLDLPPAHREDAEALIEARVAAHDDKYNLTYVDFAGGRFTVAQKDLPIGHPVRLRVIARDVSITLKRQSDTSILNIFPVTIEDMVPESDAQLMIRLSAGGAPLLSRITRKSASLLGLEKGKSVFVQIKSVALLP